MNKYGTNMTIKYEVGQSFLGLILVAKSEKGICALFFGDDEMDLVQELQHQFPHTEIIIDTSISTDIKKIISFTDNPTQEISLPLDINGTEFQHKVWKALQDIPYGKKVSYTDIATKIGAPQSFRAVANACGENKISILIPCHRVVRSDGSISGYRWGVERKIELLKRESVNHS